MIEAAQHRARKRFGQNFLVDRDSIARIVAAIDPRADDHFLEVGPGLGALTSALLEHVEQVEAIEIDRDLAAHLARAHPPERLRLHVGDALAFDFKQVAPGTRVVGNLP